MVRFLAALALLAELAVLGGARGAAAQTGGLGSGSDEPDGASALRLYAEALGHPTTQLTRSFDLGKGSGLLFVLDPEIPLTAGEAAAAQRWVESGGVLVFAGSDLALRGRLGLAWTIPPRPAPPRSLPSGPFFAGIQRVVGASPAVFARANPSQVPVLRNVDGKITGLVMGAEAGRVIALTDPAILSNHYLGLADNGRLAADLFALAPPGSLVRFDDFHRILSRQEAPGAGEWWATAWGFALIWAIAVVFVGMAIRGRAFGARIPIGPSPDRSTAEYTAAVGGLLRRARARAVTLAVLGAAARRALAERSGMRREAAVDDLDRVLAERAPALAQELAAAERQAHAGEASDPAMLDAARQLHRLAHPLEEERN